MTQDHPSMVQKDQHYVESPVINLKFIEIYLTWLTYFSAVKTKP